MGRRKQWQERVMSLVGGGRTGVVTVGAASFVTCTSEGGNDDT